MGYGALANGANSMALGANAVATGANVIAMGSGVKAQADNTVVPDPRAKLENVMAADKSVGNLSQAFSIDRLVMPGITTLVD